MFFFFKQKTAYEMRISDWSSDVCSSDLRGHLVRLPRHGLAGRHCAADGEELDRDLVDVVQALDAVLDADLQVGLAVAQVGARRLVDEYRSRRVNGVAAERVAIGQRYRHRRIDHAVDLEQLLPPQIGRATV